MCETGTIVSAATVENGAARTCSGGELARTTKPGEHVPRMPERVPAAGLLELGLVGAGEHRTCRRARRRASGAAS